MPKCIFISLKIFIFIFVCMCVGCIICMPNSTGGEKRVLYPLEMDLQPPVNNHVRDGTHLNLSALEKQSVLLAH